MRAITFIPLLVACAFCVSAEADQHPFQQGVGLAFPVSDSSLDGLQFPPEAEIDGLTFRVSDKSSVSQLTPAEQYMFGGCMKRNGRVEEGWITKINMFILDYYGDHCSLPAAITREMLDDLVSTGTMPERLAEWYKSPITGSLPRLDQIEFTPGGVYARVLTVQEAQHLAQWDSTLRKLLTTRKLNGPDGMMADAAMSPVFYVRYYGETGLLCEGLFYIFAPLK